MTKPQTAPKHLSKEARTRWASIVETYHLTDAQLMILQGVLESYDRMKKAQQQIASDGMTFTDRFGQIKCHPLCTVERDSRSAIVHGFKALGLDLEPLDE